MDDMVKAETGCTSSTGARKRNYTALITFDENRIPQYNGSCRLRIDLLSKALFIQQMNENYNDITATFDWKFIRSKNILFAFAKSDFQDFVLVFKNEELCIKVFNGIFKRRETDSVEKELLEKRFLHPLFKYASQNSKLKDFLEEWIRQFDGKEKDEYLKLLAEQLEHSEICDNNNDIKDVKLEIGPLQKKNRKRRHHEIETNVNRSSDSVNPALISGNDDHERPAINSSSDQFTKVVDKSKFKVVCFKTGSKFRRKLLIFTSSDKTECYEFKLYRGKQYFYHRCSENFEVMKAILGLDGNGEKCIKMEDKKHECSPILYQPEKYIDYNPPKGVIILRPPKFKFMKATENFASKLFIFDSTDSTLCYTFSKMAASLKRYQCLGCKAVLQSRRKMNGNNSGTNRNVIVYLEKDVGPNGEYFVKFDAVQKHICQPKKYVPGKYDLKILKPTIDYILCRDKKRKRNIYIVVYHPDDKKLCRKYFYDKTQKFFRCSECSSKGLWVVAKLRHDSDGNEYLTLNSKQHVCVPIEYSSIIKSDTPILEKSGIVVEESKKNHRIIRLPKFELQRNKYGTPGKRLIIFFDDDRKLCYEYNCKAGRKFICKKCHVSAKVQNDKENGNEKYFILDKAKHKCQPVKYVPEKEIVEVDIETGYMIFDDETKPTKLVVFTSSTNEMCYEYSFHKQSQTFRCCGCNFLKEITQAKLLSNGEKEYVKLLKNEHACSPKKFILEDFQPKTIPESGFKLYSNRNGKPNAKLVVFDSEKDGFGYEYSSHQSVYDCLQCKYKNTTVSAKVCVKENGEKYVKLSSTQHVCESKILNPSNKFKVTTHFIVHHNRCGVRDSRLTVLNEDDKSLGHRYSYNSQNYFYCGGCLSKKKLLSARLITDKDGIQSLEFGKTEHVCDFLDLKKEKLYFDDFKFEDNGDTLITTDPNQKNRSFKFQYNEKLGTFCCVKCMEKNRYVTATICKENDEKDFVLLNVNHCCT